MYPSPTSRPAAVSDIYTNITEQRFASAGNDLNTISTHDIVSINSKNEGKEAVFAEKPIKFNFGVVCSS